MIDLERIKELKDDVYGCTKRLRMLLDKLKDEPINETSKQQILAFIKDFLARGNTTIRALKYGYNLRKLASMIDKPLDSMNKAEVTDLVLKIQMSPLKSNTQKDLLVCLKKFYKYSKGYENGTPLEIAWIKTQYTYNLITKDDLITRDEFALMLGACKKIQDRLLFSLLHETGARIGELLMLTLDRIQWDEENDCYQLSIYGKTGFRVIPVMQNIELLREYMEVHEFKNTPKCPLFHVRHKVKALSYMGLKKRFTTIIGRTGIKKRIHPHLFRHTDITEKCSELSEQIMKRLYGWTPDSKMLNTYSHLNNTVVTQKLKEFYQHKEAKLVTQKATT